MNSALTHSPTRMALTTSRPRKRSRGRTARFIRRAIVLLAVCSLSAAATSAQQQKNDDVIRVSTDLVQTDFMVFDKQGNFVDGLKREQFVFKVEGKPREISFFDRIAAGSRSEEAQLAAARGETVPGGPAPVPLDRGRTILFFIDDLHMSPGSVSYARRMLKQFIDDEMKQNDQAQIASTTGLGFLQQLTDNKSVLNGAADRLRSNQMVESIERPPINEYQAIQIERHDDELLRFFAVALVRQQGEDPTEQNIQRAEDVIMNRAAQIIAEGQSITTRTLSNLRGFINLTSVLPGRKIVFFISDGFLLVQRRSDNFDRLQRIINSAARNGVVVYSLDARGLGAGLPDASHAAMADPTGVLTRASSSEVKASQDAMNSLVSDTGGRAFFNTNSMPNAVAAALKETSTYYLLAWRPETEEQRNPKFRRIEVSVLDRPDLVVRFRRGFGEAPLETAKSKPKEAEALPIRKTPADEINNLLRAQYPATTMPVAIALNFIDTAQYGGTLTTSIKIGTGALTLEKEPDGSLASLDLAGVVLNDQGKSISSFNKRFTIKSGTAASNKPPENIFYNHFAMVKPGLYQVRVAAIDVRKGTRGSAYEWVEIPNVADKGLAMSSLIVGERKSTDQTEAVLAISNDPQQPQEFKTVMVNVDHRFASSSYLRFLTFVYNASAAAPKANPATGGNAVPARTNSGAPDLAVQVHVFRDDQPVITTPLHKIQTDGMPDLQRVPYAADVPLAGLSPGAYILQVTVIDKLAKASATRKISFTIE